MAANPLQLVRFAYYRGALDSIAAARPAFAARRKSAPVQVRSNKTMAIVIELSRLAGSASGWRVGTQSGGVVRRYVQTLLVEGNVRQLDAPLAEAEALLSTLVRSLGVLREEGLRPRQDMPHLQASP